MDKDSATRSYMQNPKHFADAINGYFFSGQQIVKPDHLRELDTAEFKHDEGMKKYRDILKEAVIMEDDRMTFAIFGIEAQSAVHYAMPVRNFIYDALHYDRQLQEIRDRHKEDKDLRGDEYTSGISKTDKLKPVVTLTIYFGARPWDGPRTLKAMLNYPEILDPYINDYDINLLAPLEVEDFEVFQTEFRKVLKLITSLKSKEDLYAASRHVEYNNMSKETNRFVTIITGGKIKFKKKGEQTIMFPAFEEIKEDGIKIGEVRGETRGEARGEARGLVRGVENFAKISEVSIEVACHAYGCTMQEYKAAKALLASQSA
jgi:hypothetical protein